jgi:septum formation protein
VYHPRVRLILASASPRRADLLRSAGFAFEVRSPSVDETVLPGEDAHAHVTRLATAKADAAAATTDPGEVVLAADTVVVVDGCILGKPRDEADAAAMLRRISGRAHEVVTGVCLRQGGRSAVAVERTVVHFSPLTEEDLAWYVASGEPRDKAGAYGIQGLASRFVERIEGSYGNVVGLPVALVVRLLRDLAPPSPGDEQ